MKVECPRCHTHVDKPASGNPICPTCGFGAPGSGTEGAPVIAEESHLETARPNVTPHQAGTGAWAAQGPGNSWSVPAAGGMRTEPAKGMAIAALVLGIVGFLTGLIFIGLLLDIVAIVLGSVAAVKAKNDPLHYGGRGMAITGAILAAVGFVLTILFFVLAIVGAGGIQDLIDQYCDDNPDDPNCQELQNQTQAAQAPAPTLRPTPAFGLAPMGLMAAPATWSR